MLSSLFPGSSSKDDQQKQRRKRQSPAPSTIPRHRSCEGCRLRKLKCSRTENCLQCQKRNAQCVWVGSAPSRSSEDATLEASEAEVLRLNKVIMQLEARIANMEHGKPEGDPTPVASTSGALSRTMTGASSDSDVDIPSPQSESRRPSTSSSRASSVPPIAETAPPSVVMPEAYSHHYGAGAPAARFSANHAPTPRATPSLYSVDSYNVPSLTASSSVTSFASSLQTVPDGYHIRDPRYTYGGPPTHQPHHFYPPQPQPQAQLQQQPQARPPSHRQPHAHSHSQPPSHAHSQSHSHSLHQVQPAPAPQVQFYAPQPQHHHQSWSIEDQRQHRQPVQPIKEELQEFTPYEAFTRAFGGGANRW